MYNHKTVRVQLNSLKSAGKVTTVVVTGERHMKEK